MKTKIYWRKHGKYNFTYSIRMDDHNLAYGLDSQEEAEFICSVARLVAEKCGKKVLNSFDSQNE